MGVEGKRVARNTDGSIDRDRWVAGRKRFKEFVPKWYQAMNDELGDKHWISGGLVATGAGLGATLGALSGKNRLRNAILGGLLGGTIGGITGYAGASDQILDKLIDLFPEYYRGRLVAARKRVEENAEKAGNTYNPRLKDKYKLIN